MDKIKDIEVTETVTMETVKTIDYRKDELEKAIEEFKGCLEILSHNLIFSLLFKA